MSLPAPLQSISHDGVFLKLVGALLLALIAAYLLNRLLGRLGAIVLERLNRRAAGDALLAQKRSETFLNVGAAVVRSVVTVSILYLAWRLTAPASGQVALIGAGTIFIVIGGVTLGPLLRDLTNGIVMIIEQWYNVGDHIAIEPFGGVSGVVERLNLRATKLRSLTGEVIWVHNQYIQGVRVTPRGVRTISIDTFVTDPTRGRKLLNRTFEELPVGPTMIIAPMTITDEEEHGGVWRLTATGQTTPGREWLIEDFAIGALRQADSRGRSPVIVYGPIVRYTDAAAEQRFKRSLRPRRSKGARGR